MSAVSATSTDLTQFIQSLNSTASSSTTASNLAQASATDNDTTTDGTQAATSGHHHHHHHGGGPQLSSQLESAITSALSADGGKSDPNQIVQNTIKQFLAAGNQSGSVTAANPSGSAAPGSASSASAADSTSDQSSFESVLQSYGINANQFQQDLHAAVSNGDGSSVDFAQLFQSLPVGSTIDTNA